MYTCKHSSSSTKSELEPIEEAFNILVNITLVSLGYVTPQVLLSLLFLNFFLPWNRRDPIYFMIYIRSAVFIVREVRSSMLFVVRSSIFEGRSCWCCTVDLYDLHGLYEYSNSVDGWDRYDLHGDPARTSEVKLLGSVPYRSCTTSQITTADIESVQSKIVICEPLRTKSFHHAP